LSAPTTLSLPEARRLAVAAQGFASPRPAAPSAAHLRRLAARLHAFQIDSVNVLVRAHYVPAFARLGPYATDDLDALTHQRRELFEYWGHAASLLPISLYPLVRYRMRADLAWEHMRSEKGAATARVYEEVAERGPLTTAELSAPGQKSGRWWGWAPGKIALERLYDAGILAIAGRRGFERRYDLAERVIPRAILDAPVPSREEAMKRLICLAADACGVGTYRDLTGYLEVDGWRDRRLIAGPWWQRSDARAKPIGRRLVTELVEEGRLLPGRVDGWTEAAYLHPDARVPRAVDARAIVTPFDSLVWERSRIDRLFGMKYTIELYTPPEKRVYGYYVCPFLLGDTLAGRVDLKADRRRGVLMVPGAFAEPGQDGARVAPDLAAELRRMAAWLELDRIEIGERGDLAPALAWCL
jgi:uncharacterized protein YcaQ